MTPLVFGYVEARRITLELELAGRRQGESQASIKEWLGRALINWGERLTPVAPERTARHAA
jgi:hypothetical protein